MKFISYKLNTDEDECSLDIGHSSLSFDSVSKPEALQKLGNYRYSYRSIPGVTLGRVKSEDSQLNVYVPLNQQGLLFVQQTYYFIVTSVIVIFLASYVYKLISVPNEGAVYDFSTFHTFYQSIFHYGFSFSHFDSNMSNTISMGFLMMTPFFSIVELSITMLIYLFVKPLLSFLPSRVLKLIFHDLFKI